MKPVQWTFYCSHVAVHRMLLVWVPECACRYFDYEGEESVSRFGFLQADYCLIPFTCPVVVQKDILVQIVPERANWMKLRKASAQGKRVR